MFVEAQQLIKGPIYGTHNHWEQQMFHFSINQMIKVWQRKKSNDFSNVPFFLCAFESKLIVFLSQLITCKKITRKAFCAEQCGH